MGGGGGCAVYSHSSGCDNERQTLSTFLPTRLSPSPHFLLLSEDGQTDQIDKFGERTGLSEIDLSFSSLFRSQMLAESTASDLILHVLSIHHQGSM